MWDRCEALISLNIESSLSEGTKSSHNFWCNKFRTFCAEVDRDSHQFNSKTVFGFLSSLAEQSAGVEVWTKHEPRSDTPTYQSSPVRNDSSQKEKVYITKDKLRLQIRGSVSHTALHLFQIQRNKRSSVSSIVFQANDKSVNCPKGKLSQLSEARTAKIFGNSKLTFTQSFYQDHNICSASKLENSKVEIFTLADILS